MTEVEVEDIEATTSEVEAEAMADLIIIIMQQSNGDLLKTEIKEEGHGTDRVFNVSTVKSLATMNTTLERNSQISTEAINLSSSEGESSETMFLSCHLSEDKQSEDIWLLDSRCSNHTTGNKHQIGRAHV